MVKRKCGTCRHFSDGGVAGSGWCQHPARRDLQHMVLVRKSELACRNGWDQDLWEMGAEPFVSGTAHQADQFSRPNGTGSGFSPDMIPDPAIADANVGEIFTDKIQSIGLSLRPVDLAPTDAPMQGATNEQGNEAPDSRSAVREARRRRQEQRGQEQRRHQQALADAAGVMLDQSTKAEPAGPTPSSVPPAPPVERPIPERPTPPTRVPVGEIRRPAHVDDRPPKVARKVEPRDDRETDEWLEVRRSPDRFGAPKSPRRDGDEPRRKIDGGTEPLPIEQLQAEMAADIAEPPVVRVDVTGSTPAYIEPPIPHRETTWITGAGAIGKIRRPSRQEIAADGAAHEVRLPLAMPRDPIDASELGSSVPRCCATCRDFKRVGDGTRGWCVNPHAFTERRMVESDEISCRSSIGTWWLPSDDLWLERVDMTHHGRPTPLLDQLHGDDLVDSHEMESRPF